MIGDLKRRTLKWIFENVYQPANPENLNDREMKLVAGAINEFCVFAGGNPAISKIGNEELAQFRLFLKAKGRSGDYCYRRRGWVQKVVHHVLPPPPDICQQPPEAGTLRHHASDRKLMKILAGNDADVDRYMKDAGIAIRKLCRFVGRDLLVAEVTPELISQLEESLDGKSGAKMCAWVLRRVMQTVDPVRFRFRAYSGGGVRPCQPRPKTDSSSTYYLDNLYDQLFEPRRLRSCRPNTKRLYRRTLCAFAQFLERPPTIDDLTDETLNRFAVKRRADKVAPSSINRDLENLLCIWRWCCDQNLIETRPDVQLEKIPKEVPVAWTKDEIHRLLRAIRQQKGSVGPHLARDWWAALLQVIFCSGERIGAVTKLDWKNVDLRRRTAIFLADDRKGGVEPNPVRLSKEAVAALRRIQVDGGPVFAWPNHPTYLWRKYGKIIEAAGLPNDRARKFHCIRKTVASYIERLSEYWHCVNR